MLEPGIKELAGAANFATLAFLSPDGSPAGHLMWIDHDHEHLLLNTETGRWKFQALDRDRRVVLVIWDRDDPYRYAEVRGRLVGTITGPRAREHIDELSNKYHGRPYANPIRTERVILKIAPVRQRVAG